MLERPSDRKRLRRIEGLLIDLDGVLYVGEEVIDGAPKAVARIKEAGIPIRFVTNTTTRSRPILHEWAERLGLPIEVHEIINAPRAAAGYLRSIGNPRCRFVVSEDVLEEFEGIPQDDSHPEIIVIGDIGDRWDYELLSELFAAIVDGAKLVALHKGRYYQGPEGLILDIGGFVAALEYATGTVATVIGKPSAPFFHAAAADMSLTPSRAAMVGDDIESDVGGAQKAGLAGILVKTGKYRSHLAAASSVRPDAVVPSIADVPNLLGI
jgi:HAD superfamily hydrolase (TIGR01458 family)